MVNTDPRQMQVVNMRKFDHVVWGGQLQTPDYEKQGAAAAEQHNAGVHAAVGQGAVMLLNQSNLVI